MDIRAYRPDDFAGLDALWHEAFPDDAPRNRAAHAVPQKRAVQPDLLFVAIEDGEVVGSIMAGYDGHRGWLNAVAVRAGHRRTGLGTTLVRHAERALRAIGCEKVNLQVRATNAAVVGFYEAIGYTVEERVSMGRLI